VEDHVFQFMHMVLQKPAAKWGTQLILCLHIIWKEHCVKELETLKLMVLGNIPSLVVENVNTISHAIFVKKK